MSQAISEKEARFERLWAGETPKGVNRTKALKFRQYMKQHVLQKYHKEGRNSSQALTKATTITASPANTCSLQRRIAENTGWVSCNKKSRTRRASEAILC